MTSTRHVSSLAFQLFTPEASPGQSKNHYNRNVVSAAKLTHILLCKVSTWSCSILAFGQISHSSEVLLKQDLLNGYQLADNKPEEIQMNHHVNIPSKWGCYLAICQKLLYPLQILVTNPFACKGLMTNLFIVRVFRYVILESPMQGKESGAQNELNLTPINIYEAH